MTVESLHRRGLIDTDVVVHLGRLPAEVLPAEMLISAVTLAELAAGPALAEEAAERARRTSVLRRTESIFAPLPFDAAAARVFGQVNAAMGRKPRRRVADLLIASAAIATRLPLYTISPDDFTGLEDLLRIVPVPRPSDR